MTGFVAVVGAIVAGTTAWAAAATAESGAASSASLPDTILFLGDSLTEGYHVPATAAFPHLVEAKLEARLGRPVTAINGGVSGSTTASGLERLNWYLKRDPDVLVLALGANDGLRGMPVDKAKANLLAIIDRAHDAGLSVVLAGMRMPPNYGNDYTKAFRAMYHEIAAEREVRFIPFLLAGVAADKSLNLPDGIHPNAAGYRVVAETVYRELEALLSSSP